MTIRDPIIERLIELGYTSFKLVNEVAHRAAPPIFEHEIGWRFLRKIGRAVPPIGSALRGLAQRLPMRSEWDPPGKLAVDGYEFGDYGSGPFGDVAAGDWLAPRDALRKFAWLRTASSSPGRSAYSGGTCTPGVCSPASTARLC
jgi:hypothetical protein